MATLFTKIIDGEIPSHRIYEDDHAFAFLDINPRSEGHTLVVPKMEVDHLFDLPADAYSALWEAVRSVATGLQEATGCARIVVVVLGYEVPHAHVHLIPSNHMDDLPLPAVDEVAASRLAETAATITAALGS